MKGRRKIIFSILCLFVLFGLLGFLFYPKKDIQEILQSDAYSYLPVEAQNYVEKVFEESGEVVLTEKNKKENVPYLNPQFIEYLSLSEAEKSEVEEVPEVYRLDYVSEEISGATYPTTYDLRNVNGKNFVTNIKDQDTLDLCWAFTSSEQIESFLLKNSNTSFNSSSVVLSPRQLDYATSYDGIISYDNDFGVRPIGFGGNYLMAAAAMSNGIAMIPESKMPFTTESSPKKLSDVLNYDNSLYELNQSIMVPTLSNPTTTQLSSYISKVKQYVMDYGGVYAATQSPNRSCGSLNSDGNVIVRVDNNCVQNNNHAMHIIGWDDNYSYSYCAMGSYHTNNTSNCSGTVVNGTGAWLLRNSWGDDTPYLYLAYDSLDYDVRLSTAISSMSDRTWDNNYHSEYNQYYILTTSSGAQYFEKKIDTVEKLEKIKLYIFGEGAKYTISIASSKENYRKIKTISVPTAGLYTIDFHNDNVLLSDSGFSVEILAVSGNQAYFVKDSISVFTSNVDTTPVIQTEDYYDATTSGTRSFYLLSQTKNIDSNTSLTYSLTKENGSNASSYLTITDKVVSINNVNAKITLSSSIPNGTYYLKTQYGSASTTSKIVLGTNTMSGSGTVSNPYQITNENELRAVANKLDAHYKLMNDITLTTDWEPLGDRSVPFTGSFDGNGHKIINMVVSRGHDQSGFFGMVVGNQSGTTTIKNLTFVNAQVDGDNDTGILMGVLSAEGDIYEPPTFTTTIQDIYIMGGHAYSYYGNAGALIGSLESPINEIYGKHTYKINRIFNSSAVGGVQASGLIGYVIGPANSDYAPTIQLTNIDNVGDYYYDAIRTSYTTFFTGSHGTMIGYMLNFVTIDLKYYISTAYFRGYSYSNDGLFGTSSSYVTITKSNGYTILDSNTSLSTIRNATYNWTGFSTNWTQQTVDNIKRIPVLKNVNFTYTSFPEITINQGDTVTLSDYLNASDYAMKKLSVGSPSNSSVISVQTVTDAKTGISFDAKITGLTPGTSTLSVANVYDGYDKSITIRVVGEEMATITFYKNNGTSTTRTQTAVAGSTVTLDPNPFYVGGYKFVSWNTVADGSGTSFSDQAQVTLNSNANLYAQWAPIEYTIQYRSNGGSGTMSDTTASYNQTVTLRKNTFTKRNYTFTGWNTKSDGTGTSYPDEASIKNLSSTDGDVITLYAQWRSNSSSENYTINNYTVHDGYIDDILPKTTLNDYKSHFVLEGYTMEVEMGNATYIATGSKTILYKNGVKEIEFTNVVRGDPSGDGQVNSADLLKIVKHLKGTTLDASGRYAADCNFDNTINSADLLKIVKYLKGTGTISR